MREFVRGLADADQAEVLAAMRRVALHGLHQARHLRGEIWEVRTSGENLAFRVLFAKEGSFGQILLSLEAFSKKTQKTPPAKINLAEQRLADWRRRGRERKAQRG